MGKRLSYFVRNAYNAASSKARVALTFFVSLLLVGGFFPGRLQASKKQRTVHGTFSILTRKYRRLKDMLHQPAWLLEGTEPGSGQSFRLLYSGTEANKNYIARAAFGGGSSEQPLGSVNLWQLDRNASQDFPGCALVITETGEDRRRIRSLVASDLIVPLMMPVSIDLAGTVKESIRKSAYDYIMRKTRQNKLEYEARTDDAAFDEFYHSMYAPHITARHGNRAMLTPYENLKDRFRHGELVMVKTAGETAGAMLLDFGHEQPRLLELGVMDGKEEFVKKGVSNAAYLFAFEEILKKRGRATAGLGNSSAFLNDGPLSFKISLGGRIENRHYEGAGILQVKFLEWTEGLKGFLARNPMVTTDGNGTYTAAAFAAPGAALDGIGELFAKVCNPNVRPALYLFAEETEISSSAPDAKTLPADTRIASAYSLRA